MITHTDDNNTLILSIVLGHEADEETEAHWRKRFHRFYSPEQARIEYPVSCDTHAEDVFRDEFIDVPTWTGYVAIIVLPYGPDDFVPFTEESAGYELATWTEEDGWQDAV